MLEAGRGDGMLYLLAPDGVSLQRVPFIRHGLRTRAPLLFIHGIEFATPEETLTDLVLPMLDALGPERTSERDVYVFVWNSLLTNRVKINEVLNVSRLKQLWFAVTELPRCRTYLMDVERRAKEAAQCLLPFALEWNAENRVGPTVITHSMGSLVWAETLKLLYESSALFSKPGVWWSLQPAISRRAFQAGGEYHVVPKIYTGRDAAKAMVWYSRLDYILSTIYLVSKREFALGQRGCPEASIPQKDVTAWVKEAHGMQCLQSKWGHFFERVKPILAAEADALGI